MGQLGDKDQTALVLRFFEDRSFKDISSALGTTEAGAKMRVNRALEKLRLFFTKRGLIFSANAIGGAISAHSLHAAPVGLAASITVAAVKGTTGTTTTLTLINTTLKLMAWTKIKTAVVVSAVALLAVGTATFTLQQAKARRSSGFNFAGYSTPEASVESTFWAGGRGDFKAVLAGCTTEHIKLIEEKVAGKSDEEISRWTKGWANAFKDYKITQKEVISDTEVHLHIHATPSAGGLGSGKVVVVMRKVSNEWKQQGDL
jgi:hypothetical protein